MSDIEDNIETEVETEVEQPEVNPTNELLNHILDQDFAKAGPMFSDILGDKIADALEQERVNVADRMFNGSDEDVEDEEDLDISDEEIEELDNEIDDEEAYDDDYQNEPSDPREDDI